MKNILKLDDSLLEELKILLDAINFNYEKRGNKAIKFWVGNITADLSNTFKEKFEIRLVLEIKDYAYNLKKNIKETLEKKFSLPNIEDFFESSEFSKFEDSVDRTVKRIKANISKEDWDLFFKCHEEYITQSNDTYNEDNWINFENGGFIRRYNMRNTKYKFPYLYNLNENPSGTITFRNFSPLLDISEKTIDEIVSPFDSIFTDFYYSLEERAISTTNRNNKDNYTLTEFMDENYKLPEIILTKNKAINLMFLEDDSINNYIKYPMISFKTFFREEYRKTNIDHKDIEKFSNGVITEKNFPKSYHESKKWREILKEHIQELERNTKKKYEGLIEVLRLINKTTSTEKLMVHKSNDDLLVVSDFSTIAFKDVFINHYNKPSYILYKDYELLDLCDTYQILINLYVDFFKKLITERNKIKEEK